MGEYNVSDAILQFGWLRCGITYIDTCVHAALDASTFQNQLRLLSQLINNPLTKLLSTLLLLNQNWPHTRNEFFRLGQAVLVYISDHDGFSTCSISCQQGDETNGPSTTDNKRVCQPES